MAGVQAHAQPLVAAGGLDERGELAEGAAERPARAGGVLEVERAPSVCASASAMTSPARVIAAPTSPVFAEPGCSTTPWAPSAAPACSDATSERSVLARMSASSVAQLSR